jgi:hypothetical protein
MPSKTPFNAKKKKKKKKRRATAAGIAARNS